MLAGDTGLDGSFDATEVGWLAQSASEYDGPGKGFGEGESSALLDRPPSVGKNKQYREHYSPNYDEQSGSEADICTQPKEVAPFCSGYGSEFLPQRAGGKCAAKPQDRSAHEDRQGSSEQKTRQ